MPENFTEQQLENISKIVAVSISGLSESFGITFDNDEIKKIKDGFLQDFKTNNAVQKALDFYNKNIEP